MVRGIDAESIQGLGIYSSHGVMSRGYKTHQNLFIARLCELDLIVLPNRVLVPTSPMQLRARYDSDQCLTAGCERGREASGSLDYLVAGPRDA